MLAFLLVASVAAAATPEPTMPLSDVRPGMQAIVRTVFEGARVEEVDAEILGVMDNALGPSQDLILVRLKGDRVAFTGVAAGMSGSPVYVSGKLVGALAYRMGVFAKEPIAGITPIEYMLNVAEPAKTLAGGETALLAPSRAEGLQPIEIPVAVAGVPARALDFYASELAGLGFERIVTGAALMGAAAPPAASADANARPAEGLKPGDAVAAQLVRGDISFAATGTVTYVDGDRVLAFGHPVFFSGPAELPMARAEIYVTLASVQASSKMSRVLDTIGTFQQSRLPALTGLLGPKPSLVPVTVRVTGAGADRGERVFHYEVANHKVLTPPLVGFVTASSLISTPWYADEMTLSLSGRVLLEGHPDLILNDVYSDLPGGQPPAATLARDVQGLFGAVFQNRWTRPGVRAVSLQVATVEKSEIGLVEGIYPTRTDLEPGESLELRVLIRPYRGEAYTRRFEWRVPEGTPSGPLAVYVGGANLLGAAERSVLARQVSQADDVDQLIALINRLRVSDRLYLKVARRQGGAIVLSEVMPSLPPSALTTLIANRGTGEVTPLGETTIHEESIPLDQIVVGGAVLALTVK